jgi:tetratricopeptide (TPR) repeat protein
MSLEIERKLADADELLEAGRSDEAAKLLRELHLEFPAVQSVTYALAHCLARIGHADEALPLCEDLINFYEDDRAKELRRTLLDENPDLLDALPDVPGIAETVMGMGGAVEKRRTDRDTVDPETGIPNIPEVDETVIGAKPQSSAPPKRTDRGAIDPDTGIPNIPEIDETVIGAKPQPSAPPKRTDRGAIDPDTGIPNIPEIDETVIGAKPQSGAPPKRTDRDAIDPDTGIPNIPDIDETVISRPKAPEPPAAGPRYLLWIGLALLALIVAILLAILF